MLSSFCSVSVSFLLKTCFCQGFTSLMIWNWMEIFFKELLLLKKKKKKMYPCYSVGSLCHKKIKKKLNGKLRKALPAPGEAAAAEGLPSRVEGGWRRSGLSVHYTTPVVALCFFSSSISAPCISYYVKYYLPGLTLVRIIESIVSCFSVFSYLVVWF